MTYEVGNISVLSDLDHIKARFGMYIGEKSSPMALFAESIDNALDELQNDSKVAVSVEVDTSTNTYTVSDTGRGIPIGLIKLPDSEQEIEVLNVLTSKTGSGAKFNNTSFKIRSGMNGVGMAVISALSSKVSYTTTRKVGKVFKSVKVMYENGTNVSTEYFDNLYDHSGVIVSFNIDESSIFDDITISKKYIIDRCKIAKIFLGDNIQLSIDSESIPLGMDSIFDLIPNKDSSVYDESVIDVSTPNGESLKVGLRFNSTNDYNHKCFTNLLVNYQGGTHERVLIRAIRRLLIDMFDKNKELKESDITGLDLIVSLFIEDANFDSQTKSRLTIENTRLNNLSSIYIDSLRKHINKNKNLFSKIMDRYLENRRKLNNSLASKNILKFISQADESMTQKNIRSNSSVTKLIECGSKSVTGTELHIVEGNSAAGPFLAARNAMTQAVLPLRGKILNVTKVDDIRALQNQEVVDILNSIGTGINDSCNPDLCRYEKIIISTDSDPDGAQIESLVLGVLMKFVPKLIESGKVYISDSSLYGYYDKGKFYPAKDLSEVPEGVKFLRFKGLGSLEPDQLKGMLLDTDTRRLLQVEAEEVDQSLEILRRSDLKTELLTDSGVIVNNR